MVRNKRDLQNAFASVKNIDAFIYAGHSGIPESYAGQGTGSRPPDAFLFLRSAPIVGSADVSGTDICDLSTANVKPRAFFFLFGCGTAGTIDQPRVGTYFGKALPPGRTSLAQAFATHFKTNVIGFAPHVDPGRISWLHPFSKDTGTRFSNFLGVQYFHNGADPVIPIVVHP